MRAKWYYQKTSKKITINGSDTAGYDKSKVECFNYHKMGHFAKECKSLGNQESRPRNQDSLRTTINVKETSSKAMIAIDGAGFDWIFMAKEEVPTNMALMDFLDSELFQMKKRLWIHRFYLRTIVVWESHNLRSIDMEDLHVYKIIKANGNTSYHKSLSSMLRKFDRQYLVDLHRLVMKRFEDNTPEGYNLLLWGDLKIMFEPNAEDAIWTSTSGTQTDKAPVYDSEGGKITGKGTLKTGKIDFEDVYFVKELQFNLFSVSQMCDKKNSVLFTELESLFYLHDIKLADEIDKKVKIIRCDNGTKFKNRVMSEFCKKNGIKKEFSIARTPQQNGVTERRNKTLIKAARTMVADSKLPTTFWAEVVNTACYVQNRVLVAKPHNKTPYELFRGDGPKWLFDIDVLTKSMNYVPVVAGTNSNDLVGTEESIGVGHSSKETGSSQDYILMPLWKDGSLFDSSSKNASNDELQPSSDAGKKDDEGVNKESGIDDQERPENSTQDVYTTGPSINTASTNVNTDYVNGDWKLVGGWATEFEKFDAQKFQMSSMGAHTFFLGLQVMQKEDEFFISQDKYVDDIMKMFGFSTVRIASIPMETSKQLLKDAEAEDVNVHLYRSMIGSLMYLTASWHDIMFVVCVCARFQVTPKVSHLHDMKRIFRYLKGQPKLGLWYPKDSPFNLEAYSNSDYAGQTIVANSTTEAEHVAAANCCGHEVIRSKTNAGLRIQLHEYQDFHSQ
ncbi:uncharacterized mitochondrial protein-like protein [Tanacetum coccineum]